MRVHSVPKHVCYRERGDHVHGLVPEQKALLRYGLGVQVGAVDEEVHLVRHREGLHFLGEDGHQLEQQ